ncbi:TAR DNA-binding protein 43-like [Clytia hemisphaerica]|uniref:RRM domain-containing protein n=1 Tax=Clytia hemisphaerica TaxID=252671 RepID=A0A7M5VGX3_9CNID
MYDGDGDSTMEPTTENTTTLEKYPCFVKIAEDETLENFIELPTEKCGSMLLSTIQGQYPNAIGLKYKSPSGSWRGVRLSESMLDPPFEGWGEAVYSITLPKSEKDTGKRKMVEESPSREPEAKLVKTGSENEYLSDLIVLGLPYKAREDNVKDYFQQFGELAMHEIKYDPVTKQSRGFAFIRFKTVAAAQKALKTTHTILGRRCEVRLPKKKEEVPLRKLFIGRLPDDTKQEDLDSYFGQFGELTDVYIPTPYRSFGFVTFASSDVARTVLLQSQHTLKGQRINVTNAEPKDEKGGKSSRSGRGNSRSSSRRHHEHSFDFKDMRELMYNSRSGLQYQHGSSRRSPPREVLDQRPSIPYTTHPAATNPYQPNDYRTLQAGGYGAPPDMRPAYPPTGQQQQFDSREMQYGAYWSTSK